MPANTLDLSGYSFKAGQRYLVGWKSASAFRHSPHQSSGAEKMSDNASLIPPTFFAPS
ncbi:MAG: hypothetical protein KAG19_06055 [Methylococcales bacterium]|nr:hypothetical protein [Methylococcales bacterium]